MNKTPENLLPPFTEAASEAAESLQKALRDGVIDARENILSVPCETQDDLGSLKYLTWADWCDTEVEDFKPETVDSLTS